MDQAGAPDCPEHQRPQAGLQGSEDHDGDFGLFSRGGGKTLGRCRAEGNMSAGPQALRLREEQRVAGAHGRPL